MGDTDGSSDAAQSAHQGRQHTKTAAQTGGFFSRVIGALSPSMTGDRVREIPDSPRALRAGMINLRRMRVEDVAIPKADISCAVTITHGRAGEVFKDSGLTRLPVYDGTLDTPLGLAHLKDLALQHGFNGKRRFSICADVAARCCLCRPRCPSVFC